MNLLKIRSLITYLMGITLIASSVTIFTASAQDNSAGRYRPEGRTFARNAANYFDDRLFEARTYDTGTDVDEFASVTIFYPLTLSFDRPNGAVVMSPGYRGTPEVYDWWGPMLASVGIITAIIETNTAEDNLEQRKNALIAGIELLKRENASEASPLTNKIDESQIAIMGHSLGGGASLRAAEELGDEIKAVVPLTPYCCELGQSFEGDLSGVSTPTLIIATADDTIAPPDTHARLLYDSINASTAKVYMEFAEGGHMIPANQGSELETQGKYVYAFLKAHFTGDTKYSDFINGEGEDSFSSYESN
ncbi:MAG: acetylxylan esterase [Gammaproteobacteria bacterium]|nr:acetylxylan esterase [Gammaproteobacteria bacterium]MDD9896299.1 acetylxylan esterase [Gammaproteobacteria bacterium]